MDHIEQFLRDRGAGEIPHPGGTLLAHLARVADTLASWGADHDIQSAGRCHAMYGTDGFNQALLELRDREVLRALIGDRAEGLVYLYGSCDRSAVYPRLDSRPVVFRDRFTGHQRQLTDLELRALLEITAANELDVMTHNAELAATHGKSLYALFDRGKAHLSFPAWRACQVLK